MFSSRHHAILYAFIARSVIETLGKDKGERIVVEAIKTYGKQRGKRMALRAMEDGHTLTMDAYLAYGEWEAGQGEIELSAEQQGSDFKTVISKCPWHDTWKEYDLLDYGKYYCSHIDVALVEGFDPALEINVSSTLTNDSDPCEFLFIKANPVENKISPEQKTMMPWEYHTGHLFKTFGNVIKRMAKPVGDKIMAMALKDFNAFFSEESGDKVKNYMETNFENLPQDK